MSTERVVWDVQWMDKDGTWMPHRPYMSKNDAENLYNECVSVRPSRERFRMVKISTIVDVISESRTEQP